MGIPHEILKNLMLEIDAALNLPKSAPEDKNAAIAAIAIELDHFNHAHLALQYMPGGHGAWTVQECARHLADLTLRRLKIRPEHE